jgi:RNA polymerase sigma factor for flagellar operon FliA
VTEQELVESHLPLVRHVVFQVAVRFPHHVDREELVRAGSLGLVEAARRWDAERGVPFHRFAAQRIRGAILDSVRAADWAPRSVRASGRELAEVARRLHAESGRSATVAELAHALGVEPEAVLQIRQRVAGSVLLALDVVQGDVDDHRTVGDSVVDVRPGPDEAVEQADLLERLRLAVKALPARHQQVIAGYFFGERSSADLAADLGVTESRISQLRSQGLEKLRLVLADDPQPRNATKDGSVSRPLAASTAR